MSPNESAQIAALAALDEPLRHALYQYVTRQQKPVSKNQAAEAVGISRAQASFHLDKLAEKGLLETNYQRLTERTGPGLGVGTSCTDAHTDN